MAQTTVGGNILPPTSKLTELHERLARSLRKQDA
jgi:hypothetical protein